MTMFNPPILGREVADKPKKPRNKRFEVFRMIGKRRDMKVADVFSETLEGALFESHMFFDPLGWKVELELAKGPGKGSGKKKTTMAFQW